MKRIRLIGFILFATLIISIFTSSCDDLSRQPRLDKCLLCFNKNGGEQTIHIKLKNGISYDFHELWIRNTDGTKGERVRLFIEVLEDGTQQIQHDWLTIQKSRDMKTVKVTVKPNTTGKYRRACIRAGGYILGDFFVIQSNNMIVPNG